MSNDEREEIKDSNWESVHYEAAFEEDDEDMHPYNSRHQQDDIEGKGLKQILNNSKDNSISD